MDKFINFDPVTVLQRLYQIKAEQDGENVKIKAYTIEI